ncbi:MAG: M20 family metallopeptidase [Pyrinomonadaceae bacterium]
MNPNGLLEYYQSKNLEIQKSIKEIVEIESPSFGEEGSRRVVDWIEARFNQISKTDFRIEKLFAEGFGEHLIVRHFADEKGVKPIFILGHTDTVHPLGSKEKNPTRVENGRLYGCGTFDMKANIALLIEVFRALQYFGMKPKRPVTILLSCDEEVGSSTGRPLVEREAKKAELCLIFEPSAEGRVKTGRKGTGMYTLKTHGIPSHAGLDPEKGASAILEISRQIEKLHSLNAPEKGTTVNVCTIKGGTASNVIPENASCEIDVRFSSVEEAQRIEKELRELKPFDQRVKLELIGEINRPPLERTERVVGLFERAKDLAASFGYELGETQVGGASDGNFVGALGVPVLDGLGIAGNGAHTLKEYVLIEDITRRATLLTLLLTEL